MFYRMSAAILAVFVLGAVVPRICPELTCLSDSDIQTLARDALLRLTSTDTHNCMFRLSHCFDMVSFYTDSEEKPGMLEYTLDRFIRDQRPYEPNAREVFGDYDSLPESVRKVVLDTGAPMAVDREEYTGSVSRAWRCRRSRGRCT